MLPLNVDFEVALKSNYDVFQIKSSPYKNKIKKKKTYQLTRKENIPFNHQFKTVL